MSMYSCVFNAKIQLKDFKVHFVIWMNNFNQLPIPPSSIMVVFLFFKNLLKCLLQFLEKKILGNIL